MVTEDTAQSSGSDSGRQVELSAGAAVDATRVPSNGTSTM